MTTQNIKVRKTARGIRLWIEGDRLSNAGFNRGVKYTRTISHGVILLTLDIDGSKKVSGKTKSGKDHSIIDITASKPFDGFEIGQNVEVTYTQNSIVMTAQ